MVDFSTILQLVEFILCVLYDDVVLIVIPDCLEAIAFYARIVAAVHIDVREQIQGLKLVIAHILLILVVANITLIRFWVRTEEDLLRDRVSNLCSRCLQKEREQEIKKGYRFLNKFGFINSKREYAF